MIFRNTIRLLLSNFSSVWKVLLYYVICILLTVGICWSFASPILAKLIDNNVFDNLFEGFLGFYNNPIEAVTSINLTATKIGKILLNSIEFRFSIVFLIIWLGFVFPCMLDVVTLAVGEVLYGFMTSQVKFSFTGRFIKNIGKSSIYVMLKYAVLLLMNLMIGGLLIGVMKLVLLRNALYIFLALMVLVFILGFIAFKNTLFSCWLPAISVLDCKVPKAIKQNFKCVFRNFFNIYSNCLTLILTLFVINAIFCVFTFGISLIITLPLSAVVFIIFQMVSYFSTQGMRFYVYQDVFISPKRMEEQDKFKKLKFLI